MFKHKKNTSTHSSHSYDGDGKGASRKKLVTETTSGEREKFNALSTKSDDGGTTYEDYKIAEDDTLYKIVRKKFPYMKYDEEMLQAKVNEIAALNGVEPGVIKAGKTLRIPYSAQDRENLSKHIPEALPSADKEEQTVKDWSAKTGHPVTVTRGDKVKESTYKNQEHTGIQYFILHSGKKEGLVMNEAYSHNTKTDNGYFNKEEIAQGDYSKVPMVVINGCESDENMDGFLKGGAPQAFGYFYRIEDELASELGPQILNQSVSGDAEQMHQFTRQKMMEYKKRGVAATYWAGLIDKYQEYSTDRYCSSDQYSLDTKNLNWDKHNAKEVRKSSKTNSHIKADRTTLANLNKEIREDQKKIKKGDTAGNLKEELQTKLLEKETLQKQMILQKQLKGQKGEEKSSDVQKILKQEEAVVEIKQIDEGQYIAMVTTKDDTTPKVIYLPNTGRGVEKHIRYQSNMVKFNRKDPAEFQANYNVVWLRIQSYLNSKNVKRIYYKPSGSYNNVNVNTLFSNGQYILEMLDVQYLY